MKSRAILLGLMCLMAVANIASAVVIRGINIDFVTIGNAGNAADNQVMDDDTTGYGSVGYNYSIGKYEVTNAQWNIFTTIGGPPTGNPSNAYDQGATYPYDQQPSNGVSWYEALQFCNYLTSGDKSKGAYQFSGDNANPGDFVGIDRPTALATYGVIYVLPTENEWYKAAYYKPNGSGYSLYSNGLDTIPAADNGWNYDGGSYSIPWNVGTGTEEQNGTFDMMGNVWEWNESLVYGPYRGARGGSFITSDNILASSTRDSLNPYNEFTSYGFRVASVPEPTTFLLLGLGAVIVRKKHRV